MKRLFILLVFITMAGLAKAQEEIPAGKKQEEIEALKVAFISKELALTPTEAQQFWPLFNQYSQELKSTRVDNQGDVLERDEKVLNLRKKYKDGFVKILGPQRVNNMYSAEGKFNQLLIKAWRRQNNLQNKPNRPLLRRNQ